MTLDVVVLFAILFISITLTVPVGFALGLASMVTFAIFSDVSMIIVPQSSVTGLDSFPMMAIPFFIMAGIVMSKGGVAKRLVNVADALVGHITGGLAIVTTMACMFFGSISGSAAATCSAIGGFMIPEMKAKGYDAPFAASITACAGTIGLLIPPSLSLVIYGVVTNTSIGDLFIAAIIPGILMTIALSVACYLYAKKHGYVGGKRIGLKATLKIVWDAKWSLGAPVIILGGIYSGFFTPTEAAVVSIVYAIIVGMFIYRELDLKNLYGAAVEAMAINGMIMFMLGLATVFAKYVTLAQVPYKIVAFISSFTDSAIVILLLMNAFLLLVGCIMDNIPALIVLSPIMLPLALQAGLNHVQFGVMIVLNTTIGIVTPPYGPNLFIGATLAGTKMERMMKPLLPLLLALLIVLAIVTYIPQVSTVFLEKWQ
ncbi:TRAP transporter large permease [Deltaproteobacteria bacterium OttesenSCG-928-M10]|nr:TRAP transporter large permease [Deltaproteobacteria bacterium OttesenSCG-928-M10]